MLSNSAWQSLQIITTGYPLSKLLVPKRLPAQSLFLKAQKGLCRRLIDPNLRKQERAHVGIPSHIFFRAVCSAISCGSACYTSPVNLAEALAKQPQPVDFKANLKGGPARLGNKHDWCDGIFALDEDGWNDKSCWLCGGLWRPVPHVEHKPVQTRLVSTRSASRY